MSWRFISLVVATVVFLGCDDREPPFDLYIDDSANDQQLEIYLSAIDEWNEMSERCIGEPVIIYQGTVSDNGFQVNDLADDRAVMYTEPFEGEAYQEFEWMLPVGSDGKHIDVNGVAIFVGDIVIFWQEEPDYTATRSTVLHELGHFVGIQEHLPDPGGGQKLPIMHAGGSNERSEHLTEYDIKAFCDLWMYDCSADCF